MSRTQLKGGSGPLVLPSIGSPNGSAPPSVPSLPMTHSSSKTGIYHKKALSPIVEQPLPKKKFIEAAHAPPQPPAAPQRQGSAPARRVPSSKVAPLSEFASTTSKNGSQYTLNTPSSATGDELTASGSRNSFASDVKELKMKLARHQSDEEIEKPFSDSVDEESISYSYFHRNSPPAPPIEVSEVIPPAMQGEMEDSRRLSLIPMRTISEFQHTPISLYNFGATCYLNASLQCLLHTPTFLGALSKVYTQKVEKANKKKKRNTTTTTSTEEKGEEAEKEEEEEEVCPAVSALLELGRSNPTNVNELLIKVKKCAAKYNSQFEGPSQNDAHEFLRTFLYVVHDEINRGVGSSGPYKELEDVDGESDESAFRRWMQHIRAVDDSLVYDYFGGVTQSRCECSVCGHVSLTFEPFLDVALPLEASPISLVHRMRRNSLGTSETVDQILRETYIEDTVETLDGSNQLACSKCKKMQDGTRLLKVIVWPKILVLHLKRFTPSGKKITSKIVFPATLSVKNLRYKLYGVCCHSGSENFGHYTSCVCVHEKKDEELMRRHFNTSEKTKSEPVAHTPSRDEGKSNWYMCNDSYITQMDAKDVHNGSDKAYILFYYLM